jgi:hypothetical protein
MSIYETICFIQYTLLGHKCSEHLDMEILWFLVCLINMTCFFMSNVLMVRQILLVDFFCKDLIVLCQAIFVLAGHDL